MNPDQTALFRKALGTGVRKARRNAELSQGELGRRMHPSRNYNTISELEHGRYPCLMETIIQIAEITQTPVISILGPAFDTLQEGDSVDQPEPAPNEWTEMPKTRKLSKEERTKLFQETGSKP